MRLLLVEDEQHLSEAICQILKKHNYTVDAVYDGEDGLDYALSNVYDLILLDVMLPKKNGIEVLKGIRQSELSTPVMMLTSKSELRDRVNGLDSGADDYLPKPFATEELLARIRALLRRKGTVQADDGLTFGDLCLTPSSLTLSNGLHEIKLTLRECELMELLMIRRGIISSKELIIEKLWGFDSEAEHNNVEVYVSFLRKKLLFMKSKVIITTHRGVGYVLEVTADV